MLFQGRKQQIIEPMWDDNKSSSISDERFIVENMPSQAQELYNCAILWLKITDNWAYIGRK